VTGNTRIAYGLGIYNPDGKLCFVQIKGDEDDAWRIYLGWPNQDEIADKKKEGFHCQKIWIAKR
jgi:hypothetical protein